MNTDQTIAQLRKLKLHGMADRYEMMLNLSSTNEPTDAHTTVAMLSEAEAIYRTQRRTDLYIRNARFRYQVNPQSVVCSPERGLTMEQWVLLCECTFIDECKNIIVTGPVGSGKSHLASALGRQACLKGYKTIYHNMNRFIEELKASRLSGTYLKFLDQHAKVPLVILDDVGLKPIDSDVRIGLYEILEERMGKGSTIITSQLPISGLYDKFVDKNLAEAVLDRLTGHSEKILMAGESWRSKKRSK
jgi:DNA replication protein DnaC